PPAVSAPPDDAQLEDAVTLCRPEPTRVVPFVARPTRVAGYDILNELGRGGMGVVYKARQRALNRLVALQMILASPYADAQNLARFRTEAEAGARAAHPPHVPILQV